MIVVIVVIAITQINTMVIGFIPMFIPMCLHVIFEQIIHTENETTIALLNEGNTITIPIK